MAISPTICEYEKLQIYEYFHSGQYHDTKQQKRDEVQQNIKVQKKGEAFVNYKYELAKKILWVSIINGNDSVREEPIKEKIN